MNWLSWKLINCRSEFTYSEYIYGEIIYDIHHRRQDEGEKYDTAQHLAQNLTITWPILVITKYHRKFYCFSYVYLALCSCARYLIYIEDVDSAHIWFMYLVLKCSSDMCLYRYILLLLVTGVDVCIYKAWAIIWSLKCYHFTEFAIISFIIYQFSV